MLLQRLKRIFRSTVIYAVCASIASLPYYGTAQAQMPDNMAAAAQAAKEMKGAAINDLRSSISRLGNRAKEFAPGSVSGANTGKGMTVEDIQALMGIYKKDEEYGKQGNAYIQDLERRALTADSSDAEASAYAVLKSVTRLPKNQIMDDDPIFTKSQEILDDLDDFSKALADCSAMDDYLMQEKVVHEPIFEQCTQVIDKTGSCQIKHLYDLREPVVHESGPFNFASCGTGCINIWLGNPSDQNLRAGDNECRLFENHIMFRVVKPNAIKKVILKNIVWDDQMELFIGKQGSGQKTKLLQLPWAGAFPHAYNTTPDVMPEFVYRYAYESGEPFSCQQHISWSWNTELDITHHFREYEVNDVIDFFMRVAVQDNGEGYAKLEVQYDPGAILEGDTWTPPECFDLAKAVSDGMASGTITCVEMPTGADQNNCLSVNGYSVCEDRFGQSPLKGISRLCRKVNVTANYTYYKGDMDCYVAFDGTTVCPKNPGGGSLDDCKELADSGCAFIKSECTEGAMGSSGLCYVFTNTYDCGYDRVVSTPMANKSVNCNGSVACLGGECVDMDFTQSTDFAQAAALLHVAQQASKDLTCTGTDAQGNATGDQDVICTLFAGDGYYCKKAVGGIQDCCEQPVSVNFVDYIVMTFKLYMADSAMMSLNAELSPSFVGSYQTLHNEVVDVIQGGISEVTKPLTSFVENIAGEVTKVFEPVTTFIDQVKNMVMEEIKSLVKETLLKLGIKGSTTGALAGGGAAGAGESMGGAGAGAGAGAGTLTPALEEKAAEVAANTAETMANEVMSMLGTAFAVVGYVYLAYQIAMMVIQTVYKCEQQEYELASNRAMRQCHYIGSYCKSKVLGACMEKRFSYCCFKSPLGRVLQEQIRSQLGLDFGSAKNPSCDGISIEDFAKVDWEKIDLSEWVAMAQEAGMLGADMEKLTMDALTGTGGPFDYKGERLNAAERAQKRLEDTPIDDVRKGLQEEYVFPGDEFYAPAQ